jgi:oxygen-dependent protoporphyrinogen oxidase
MAHDGCVTLTTYVGGMRQPNLALLGEDALLELIQKDLKEVLGVDGEPRFKNIRVYEKAIPQYVVGYGKYKALLDDLEAKHSGAYFAGNYRTGISLSDSIVNGLEIAGRIHRDNE